MDRTYFADKKIMNKIDRTTVSFLMKEKLNNASEIACFFILENIYEKSFFL